MIRLFTLRDIPLLHRLSEQGIVFHAESALTQDVRPLREALVHMLIGSQYPTYIWKDDQSNGVGFAQLRQEEDETSAHIICLASKMAEGDALDEAVWLPFLEQLTAEAGRQGIHSLVAEVSEMGAELPVLRRAGFAVYTRQDVWSIHHPPAAVSNPLPRNYKLVPATSVDEWDMHLLYANTVPRLIQLVEPLPPTHLDNVWVLREDKDELAAVIHFKDGPAATWLRVYVHPTAETEPDAMIQAALHIMPPRTEHPLYCCVRRYQSWVQTALEKNGFQFMSSQALMVKHTVHHAYKPAIQLPERVHGQQPAAVRHQPLTEAKSEK